LIMEEWRQHQSILLTEAALSAVTSEFEKAFEEAAKEIAAELEQTAKKSGQSTEDILESGEQLEEAAVFGTTLVLLFFTKVVGTLALGALLTSLASFFVNKYQLGTREGAERLKIFGDFMETAAKQIGTFGMDKVGRWLVTKFVRDPAKKEAYLKSIDLVSRVIVFIICLGAAGNELKAGAEASKGVSLYFADLVKGAGIESVDSMQAVGDLFENFTDATEFVTKSFKLIAKALRNNAF